MKGLQTMDVIIGVIVVAYGIYMLYRSVSQLLKNEKIRKEYKETHKNYEEMNVYRIYVAISVVLFVLGVYLAIDPHVEENVFYYHLTYAMIAIVALSMGLDTIVKRRIIFDANGFLYEKAYYRYRNVIAVHKDHGVMKNTQIKTMDEERITVSRKMGEMFDQHYSAWKQRKKKKK